MVWHLIAFGCWPRGGGGLLFSWVVGGIRHQKYGDVLTCGTGAGVVLSCLAAVQE